MTPAQSGVARVPGRKPLFGNVRGPDGVLPGATVTLLGFDSHFDVGRDRLDTVIVQADARGSFHAQVLPGLPYLGFACGEPNATGGSTRSAVQGWFGAGALVQFECGATVGPFAVRLHGLEAWAAHGPLQLLARLEFGVGTLPYTVAMSIGTTGVAPWPALPSGSCEVRTPTGVPLLLQPAPLATESVLAVRPPRQLPCRVVDEHGEPIAGAAIRWRVGGFVDDAIDGVQTLRGRDDRLVATTGVDGTTMLVLPLEDPFEPGSAEHAMFSAWAPGHQQLVSGFHGRMWYRDDRRIEADDAQELRFTLPTAVPFRGAIRHGGDPAGAGTTVRLQVIAKLVASGRSYTHDARAFDVVVGADGTFSIDGVPDDVDSARVVLLSDDGSPAIDVLPVAGRGQGQAIDLAAIATLRLAVLDERRGPAAGHVVYLRQLTSESPAGATLRWCVDAAGRADLRLWPGDWFVFVADETAGRWQRVSLAAGDRRSLELVLAPYPRMCGRLVDDRGEPVVGAEIQLRSSKVGSIEDPDASLARSFLRAQVPRLLRGIRTGPDGLFASPCPPVPGLVLEVQICGAGRHTDRFDLVPNDQPVQLRWQ